MLTSKQNSQRWNKAYYEKNRQAILDKRAEAKQIEKKENIKMEKILPKLNPRKCIFEDGRVYWRQNGNCVEYFRKNEKQVTVILGGVAECDFAIRARETAALLFGVVGDQIIQIVGDAENVERWLQKCRTLKLM
jgi:hypothetical protein